MKKLDSAQMENLQGADQRNCAIIGALTVFAIFGGGWAVVGMVAAGAGNNCF